MTLKLMIYESKYSGTDIVEFIEEITCLSNTCITSNRGIN